MSSRKRKTRGGRGAAAADTSPSQASASDDLTAPEAEAGVRADADDRGTSEPTEAPDARVAEPVPSAAADDDQEPQAPGASEISELKPRRRKKPAGASSQAAEQARSTSSELQPPDVDRAEETAPEPDADDDQDAQDDEVADTAKEAPKTRAQLKRVLESLIFVSDQVISAQQLGRITKTKLADVREMLAELSIDYEGRGIELVEVNAGYQFRSAAASGPYVRVLVAQKPVRLTRAQLETLALIAYRQPITRPEVDDVRGVDSGSAIKVLLDRELIRILGRKEDAGRPLLYGTTPYFLEFFGMSSMQDLPTLREFTELSDEHRELFQRKTNEIGDLSGEAAASGFGAEDGQEPLEVVDATDANDAMDATDAMDAELADADADDGLADPQPVSEAERDLDSEPSAGQSMQFADASGPDASLEADEPIGSGEASAGEAPEAAEPVEPDHGPHESGFADAGPVTMADGVQDPDPEPPDADEPADAER